MADLHLHFDLRLSQRIQRLGILAFILTGISGDLASENVSLTTYYPAPSGVYTQMITTQNTFLARDGGGVMIGSSALPTAKLEVRGQIKITGGGPAAGRVLTTLDASGLATWQPSPTAPRCTWVGERGVYGNLGGCVDDVYITCTGGYVTNMRMGC